MTWIAKNAPPDNIKAIRPPESIRYMQRLREIDKLPPVTITVSEESSNRERKFYSREYR